VIKKSLGRKKRGIVSPLLLKKEGNAWKKEKSVFPGGKFGRHPGREPFLLLSEGRGLLRVYLLSEGKGEGSPSRKGREERGKSLFSDQPLIA